VASRDLSTGNDSIRRVRDPAARARVVDRLLRESGMNSDQLPDDQYQEFCETHDRLHLISMPFVSSPDDA
jgi:hypothetical protein